MRGDGAGEVVIQDNEVIDYRGGAFVDFATDAFDVLATLQNNTITSTKNLSINNNRYIGEGNTYNGEALPDGEFDPDWVDYGLYVPDSIGEAPMMQPEYNWVSEDGVYLLKARGAYTLEGTDGRDVLEALAKGTKMLRGGDGDDVYLLFGQNTIIENENEGFDWIINKGGWAITLPENVEGYINYSDKAMVHLRGNDLDNVLIGGVAGNERIFGNDGDDILYGGGTGGDQLVGGDGNDRMYFSEGDTRFDGGAGFDTLALYENQSLDIASMPARKIEAVDMRDAGTGAESIALDIGDILSLSDDDALFVIGDVGEDQVALSGNATQQANIDAFGEAFAHFTADNGGDLYVQIGLSLNGSEVV